MSSGAFALYIDPQAGGGNNPPIDRIVPLPHRGDHDGDDGIEFDDRRLTLSYVQPAPTTINGVAVTYLASLTVTGRFLGGAATAINVTINNGQCLVLDIPRDACAAYLHVNQPTATVLRGPLSALVEYKD